MDLQQCGHHISLEERSTESEYTFCELCETRSRLNDALQMEKRYRAERDALKAKVEQMAELFDRSPRSEGVNGVRCCYCGYRTEPSDTSPRHAEDCVQQLYQAILKGDQ